MLVFCESPAPPSTIRPLPDLPPPWTTIFFYTFISPKKSARFHRFHRRFVPFAFAPPAIQQILVTLSFGQNTDYYFLLTLFSPLKVCSSSYFAFPPYSHFFAICFVTQCSFFNEIYFFQFAEKINCIMLYNEIPKINVISFLFFCAFYFADTVKYVEKIVAQHFSTSILE